MLDLLKAKNPGIRFFSVADKEFSEYGRVIKDFDASEIITAAKAIESPESGAKYVPGVEAFECLPCTKALQEKYFGELPAQAGYCWGRNSLLNAAEWHTSSEINIAVTPLVLLLAKRCEIQDRNIPSSAFKAFYVPAGAVVEIYATTLHFTPCNAQEGIFGAVVVLPLGTNTPLEHKSGDPLLWAKNKWLLAHKDNAVLIGRGAVGGISGVNIEVKL